MIKEASFNPMYMFNRLDNLENNKPPESNLWGAVGLDFQWGIGIFYKRVVLLGWLLQKILYVDHVQFFAD